MAALAGALLAGRARLREQGGGLIEGVEGRRLPEPLGRGHGVRHRHAGGHRARGRRGEQGAAASRASRSRCSTRTTSRTRRRRTNKVLQLIDRDKVVAAPRRGRVGPLEGGRHRRRTEEDPDDHALVDQPRRHQGRPVRLPRLLHRRRAGPGRGARSSSTSSGRRGSACSSRRDDLYSSGLAEEFREEVKKLGGEIVAEKGFLKKETNFTTYINEIKDAKPDIIYAPIYYNAMALIARQAKAAGVKGDMFVGGDGWDARRALAGRRRRARGRVLHEPLRARRAVGELEEFRAATTSASTTTRRASRRQGYDAARLLADAIGRAKSDTPDGDPGGDPGHEGLPGRDRHDHHRRQAQRRQADRHRPDQGQEVHLLRHHARRGRGAAPRARAGAAPTRDGRRYVGAIRCSRRSRAPSSPASRRAR